MTKISTTFSGVAENTFSPSIRLRGDMSISVSGTFVGTIVVQRSPDNGANWFNVKEYTAPAEEAGFEPVEMTYRAGIETGNYTSGTAVVSLYGYDTWQY